MAGPGISDQGQNQGQRLRPPQKTPSGVPEAPASIRMFPSSCLRSEVRRGTKRPEERASKFPIDQSRQVADPGSRKRIQ